MKDKWEQETERVHVGGVGSVDDRELSKKILLLENPSLNSCRWVSLDHAFKHKPDTHTLTHNTDITSSLKCSHQYQILSTFKNIPPSDLLLWCENCGFLSLKDQKIHHFEPSYTNPQDLLLSTQSRYVNETD